MFYKNITNFSDDFLPCKYHQQFNSLFKTFESISSFKASEDNKEFIAKFDINEDINENEINIETDDEKNTIKIRYNIKKENSEFSSSFIETVPFYADITTLKAYIKDKTLIITMRRKIKDEI